MGTRKRDSSAIAQPPLRVLRSGRPCGHGQALPRLRPEIGLFKTLAEKRKANPNVDLLVGAVNVWCWEKDAPGIGREMQAAGIERILWSNAPPRELKAQRPGRADQPLRHLPGRDGPGEFPKLRWRPPRLADGGLAQGPDARRQRPLGRGWEIEGKDGGCIPAACSATARPCPTPGERIPAELKTHPYRCRFIDTTTASPWRECYDPDHPMTRSDSRHWKMELLMYVGERAASWSPAAKPATMPRCLSWTTSRAC